MSTCYLLSHACGHQKNKLNANFEGSTATLRTDEDSEVVIKEKKNTMIFISF